MFELNGKVAIVTGAATGLGQAIAVAFAKQGACVVPTDLPGVSLDKTVEMCRAAGAPDVLPLAMDVTSQAAIQSAVAAVKERFGRIDILASNAGMNRPMPAEDVTPESWDAHFAVNIKGGFFTAQAVAAVMKEQHSGRIIFTGSQAGIVARENQQPYCATKGGIMSMARALAYDWAKDGITVNVVAPGFITTDMTDALPEGAREALLSTIPMKRLGAAEDVARAVAFFAGEGAGYVTGQVLCVDGGMAV